MGLISKSEIKNLLRKYKIRPSKRLGQNFLIDKRVIKKMIEAAELKSEDTVLEIGPGIGALTIELAKKVKKVIAIEKDPRMCKILKELLDCWTPPAHHPVRNVEIINKDVLKLTTDNLQLTTNYKVVANLPYYIVSTVIRKFLESTQVRPVQMVLMVQKEVAQRICARPPDMNLLAVSVQFYAKPEIISYVSKKSFWPQPKVDSAILRIAPLINADRKLIDADLFFKIVKAGFSQPRKQILNNLSKKLKLNKEEVKSWLLKNNIQPSQRAETLNIEDWLELTKSLKYNND